MATANPFGALNWFKGLGLKDIGASRFIEVPYRKVFKKPEMQLILNPACVATVSAGAETSPLRFVGLEIGVFWLGFGMKGTTAYLSWRIWG